MANPDYGPQTLIPKSLAWFSSVQEPDKFASEKSDTRVLKVKMDLDNPEHKKLLDDLTTFENQRRVSYGQEETSMTTALKSRKDKQTGETVQFLQAKTSQVDKLTVLEVDGKPTDREVWMDDEVVAVVVPKFNDNAFGKPALALYLNGVRFCSPRRGGGSTIELLGGDVTLVETEEVEMVEESEAVDLGALDVS